MVALYLTIRQTTEPIFVVVVLPLEEVDDDSPTP